MASQDNQVTPTTGTETPETTRNVTGYIHFNKDDDLTKIFETLHTFRISYKLKYYHHRNDFIFFSVKSDCLSELAKVQPFKISHYSSKSTYSCTKEVAEKLLAVRDSFVRTSWDEEKGTVQFLSRTIGRVHNELVRRVFKTADEDFVRTSYHFVPHVSKESEEGTMTPRDTEPVPNTVRTTRARRGGHQRGSGNQRGGRHQQGTGREQSENDGFTRVVRDKSKYNKNRVQMESTTRTPRGQGRNKQNAPPST